MNLINNKMINNKMMKRKNRVKLMNKKIKKNTLVHLQTFRKESYNQQLTLTMTKQTQYSSNKTSTIANIKTDQCTYNHPQVSNNK